MGEDKGKKAFWKGFLFNICVFLVDFYLISVYFWQPNMLHFSDILKFNIDSLILYVFYGITLQPWFSFNKIDLSGYFATFYFLMALLTIPVLLYKTIFNKISILDAIKVFIFVYIGIPGLMFLWEWLMQNTQTPFKILWYDIFGESGGIVYLIVVGLFSFLGLVAIQDDTPGNSSYHYQSSNNDYQPTESTESSDTDSDHSIEYPESNSYTEEHRDLMDVLIEILGDDDSHGYKCTITTEGYPDVVGYGNTPEQAEEHASKEFEYQKRYVWPQVYHR